MDTGTSWKQRGAHSPQAVSRFGFRMRNDPPPECSPASVLMLLTAGIGGLPSAGFAHFGGNGEAKSVPTWVEKRIGADCSPRRPAFFGYREVLARSSPQRRVTWHNASRVRVRQRASVGLVAASAEPGPCDVLTTGSARSRRALAPILDPDPWHQSRGLLISFTRRSSQ